MIVQKQNFLGNYNYIIESKKEATRKQSLFFFFSPPSHLLLSEVCLKINVTHSLTTYGPFPNCLFHQEFSIYDLFSTGKKPYRFFLVIFKEYYVARKENVFKSRVPFDYTASSHITFRLGSYPPPSVSIPCVQSITRSCPFSLLSVFQILSSPFCLYHSCPNSHISSPLEYCNSSQYRPPYKSFLCRAHKSASSKAMSLPHSPPANPVGSF